MNLCFSTNNAHKLQELQQIMPPAIKLLSLRDIGCFDELPETQETLEGNSLQKASYVAEKHKVDCFADDTGLEIDALDGAPGVYSARYAGPACDPADNIEKVLSELSGVDSRSAKFRTVITLILGGETYQFEGEVKGEILKEPVGVEGFGYDPIFRPEGFDQAFAEMTMEEKNAISHRGRASMKLVRFLADRF